VTHLPATLPRVITRTTRVQAAADAVARGLLTVRQACIVLAVSRAEVVCELDVLSRDV
jgi:hypothetical protein